MKYKILVIDDESENLNLINEILKDDYTLSFATNGLKGLLIAEKIMPDLILLDINMPVMDGYTVCQKLKAKVTTQSIPIIFISALTDVKDIVKGFQSGGVDYISKPFNSAEIKARVNTHMSLAIVRNDLQQTLSKTLLGSIKMILELLELVNVDAFSRGNRINLYMKTAIRHLDLENPWKLELAAMLSQIGLITLPNELIYAYSLGQKLSDSDLKRIETEVQNSYKYIEHIPKLEDIAEMIKSSNKTMLDYGDKAFSSLSAAEQGGLILNLLELCDSYILQGLTPLQIQKKLYGLSKLYPERLISLGVAITEDYASPASFRVRINELTSGMILLEDINGKDNRNLLKKGTVLSPNLIRILRAQQERSNIGNTVLVRGVEE